MKVKELIKIAQENGWEFSRMRGDHRVYKKAGHIALVIPGKESADVPIGTEKSILRTILGGESPRATK